MFIPPPPRRLPLSAELDVQNAIKQLQQRVDYLSRFNGPPQDEYTPHVTGGTMPAMVPGQREFCFGVIRSDEASGSGSGSGSGHIADFPGAGFYDRDGYLAYSFDQLYDDHPWTGQVVVGGITTLFNADKTDGSNFAYVLNGEELSTGTKVVLKRAGRHWVVWGLAGSGSGSGNNASGFVTETCPDGTIHRFRWSFDANGNLILTSLDHV
jgi:hypothetical protein